MSRTIEEIQDALDAIVGSEGGDEQDAAPDLTDEQIAEVEALNAELAAAQARRAKSDEIRTKIRQGRERTTPPLVTRVDKADDTIDRAFVAYLRTGHENADLQELRAAQSEGVPSEGGFLVPDGIRKKIVERMVAFGGVANVVDEITTATGNNLPWLVEGDDTGNRAEQVAEGAGPSTGADLSFSKVSLGAYSYMAAGANGDPLRISRELVQDDEFDIVARVARKLGERGARKRSELIVKGTGVNEPQGLVTGRTGVGLYTGGSDTLVYADFLKAVHAVDPAYRDSGNCRWAFNDTFLQAIEGVLDLNGRPLLKDTTAGADGKPSGATILGYPVTIDQAFVNPSVNSGTTNFGAFGDLREGYILRNVRAVEVLVNPYSRMQQRQIEYSAWFRFDGLQQNPFSYVALTGTP